MVQKDLRRLSKRLLKPSTLLQVIIVVGLIMLIYSQRSLFGEAYNVIRSIDLAYLFIIPLIGIVNVTMIAMYYRNAMTPEYRMTIRESWGLAASMNFINQVLPSGGLSGVSLIVYRFKDNVSSATITIIQLGRYVANILSYVILLPLLFALSNLGIGETETGSLSWRDLFDIRSVIGFGVITAVLISLLVLMVRRREVLEKVVRFILSIVNAALGIGRLKKRRFDVDARTQKVSDDVHVALLYFFRNPTQTTKAFLSMMVSVACELAIVYTSLTAVGVEIGAAQVLTAMLVANLVGIISVIPGDVGVHETTMVTTLSLFSVNKALAFSAILIYRVYLKVLFLPVGYFFYRKLIKQ